MPKEQLPMTVDEHIERAEQFVLPQEGELDPVMTIAHCLLALVKLHLHEHMHVHMEADQGGHWDHE